MAAVLVVATAATAATALASEKQRRLMVHEQVADSVQTSTLAMTRLRIKALHGQRYTGRPQMVRIAAIRR